MMRDFKGRGLFWLNRKWCVVKIVVCVIKFEFVYVYVFNKDFIRISLY